MFSDISWDSYITFVIFVLAAYYLFVILKYYRNDLLQVVSEKKISGTTVVNFASIQHLEKQDHFLLAKSLADEIHAFFNEANSRKISKEELTQPLRSLLHKYHAIKDSSFTEFIQNLIKTECETNSAVHLQEAELSALWD